MLDLNKLKTRKGARIEVHFEDVLMGRIGVQMNYSHSAFEKEVCDGVDQMKIDTGKGTTIHVLINDQGIGKIIGAVEYAEWQAAPEKDWFHQGMMAVIINDFPDDDTDRIEEILSILGVRLNDFQFGDHLQENNQQFVGMTEEELAKFLDNSENLKNISSVLVSNHDCKLCPFPCPGRVQVAYI